MSLLEKTEFIRTPFRENKYPYPEVSIRELVANALIHQNFDIQGMTLSVEIFREQTDNHQSWCASHRHQPLH